MEVIRNLQLFRWILTTYAGIYTTVGVHFGYWQLNSLVHKIDSFICENLVKKREHQQNKTWALVSVVNRYKFNAEKTTKVVVLHV